MAIYQVGSRAPYTIQAGETSWSFDFRIFVEEDLAVYLIKASDPSNPVTWVYSTDYTITGIDDNDGGSIEAITTDYSAGDKIILQRAVDENKLPAFDYANSQGFDPDIMDENFDKQYAILQDQTNRMNDRMLTYAVTDDIDSGQTVLPKLTYDATNGGQIWRAGVGNALVAAEFDPSADTLRSELADQTETANGAKLVGYYDPNETPSATTVADKLDSIKDHLIGYNYLSGFSTANDSGDTEHDISIAAGECSDSTNTVIIKSSSSIIKKIDEDWEEGTGKGGFPSGLTLSINTTYHLFAISKTDGTVDYGFDTSLSATNLLADATGYTYYRRIWSVITDSSSNIINYDQFGENCYLKTPILATETTLTGSRQLVSLVVPSGIQTIALINYKFSITTTGSRHLYLVYPGSADIAPSITTAPLATASSTDLVGDGVLSKYDNYMLLTNTSSQIAARSDDADCVLNIATLGWMDQRGSL